jgi:hypothetical protein
VERLELGGRAGEVAAGLQHAGHLGEQVAGVLHVLEHLLAVDEVEALVVERKAAAVEGHELGVGSRAPGHLWRLLDVDSHPAHIRLHRAEQVDRVAGAAAEVHDALRAQPPGVVVRQHGPAVVRGNAVAEQFSEVVAKHETRCRVAACGSPSPSAC